ncbi:MAG: PSD1 and planctomycete cytochrome C domain-containing protein [Planctomycetota bacterium]
MKIHFWAIFCLFVSSIATADDRVQSVFFESRIRPVLVKHCYECHSKASGRARGGLRVDTFEALRRGGDSGPAINGKSANASLLFTSLTYHGDYQMPPSGKLSDSVIADFRRWIEMGAPDPRVTRSAPDVHSSVDIASGRNHWAYQPVANVSVPSPRNTSWPRTEIDHFVMAKLESRNLTPGEDATATVLVRRLFYTITGLPPTLAAVRRWTSELVRSDGTLDQAVIARLIDGLLRSDFYGERWGRHWLDVARFAESTGGDSNNIHQHAWRYRDYVIDSFNQDKPFDRFIIEQIAGDLLPIENDAEWAENLIATGFLAVGLKLVGEEDSQQFFADLVDEQMDATTRAFLATTVACARCHDHKSDPIPQSDYYALACIFRSTETHFGLIKAQARQATTLIDITGLGPGPSNPELSAEAYQRLIRARDDARKTVGDAMRKIRGGENVFRGTLRRIRSQRDETEAALQAYDVSGNPRVFVMGTQDRDDSLATRLLLRGEIDKPAQLIPRGFPQVLSSPNKHQLSPTVKGSGRLELARWIASERNPITARVIVNRVWHWMFGRGLVRSVDDFGKAGEPPSHPELLDFLTKRFMEQGWSVKSLVRDIASSRTWQLASDFNATSFEIDPDNRFLWRSNKRRLEGEAIRDALLMTSGALDAKRPDGTLLRDVGEGTVGQNVFEPVIRAIRSNHRSVYLPRVRSALPEVLELYDAPDAGGVSGARESTAGPLQSLYMLNSEFVSESASRLSNRLIKTNGGERIDEAYLRLFARLPTESERLLARKFMDRIPTTANLSTQQKLAAYCQVLYCTCEFKEID